MTDKKSNCDCGCVGKKQGTPKGKKDAQKPKKSR